MQIYIIYKFYINVYKSLLYYAHFFDGCQWVFAFTLFTYPTNAQRPHLTVPGPLADLHHLNIIAMHPTAHRCGYFDHAGCLCGEKACYICGEYAKAASHGVWFAGPALGRLPVQPLLTPLKSRRRTSQHSIAVAIVTVQFQASHGRRDNVVAWHHTRPSTTRTPTCAATLPCITQLTVHFCA